MTTLAAQLEPLLRDWSDRVVQEAAEGMRAVAKANCPVAPIGGGTMLDSIEVDRSGPTRWTLTVEDRGFTDEGPVAHEIRGNPLLAFDWPEQGLFPAIFRKVQWEPGEGVAMNRGWFSERSATPERWADELAVAAQVFDLG